MTKTKKTNHAEADTEDIKGGKGKGRRTEDIPRKRGEKKRDKKGHSKHKK